VSGARIDANELRKAMNDSEALRLLLLAYVQSFTVQTAHTAVANGHASLQQRLARRLLMAHDRIDVPALPLTHVAGHYYGLPEREYRRLIGWPRDARTGEAGGRG
jgi:hypothetical protein